MMTLLAAGTTVAAAGPAMDRTIATAPNVDTPSTALRLRVIRTLSPFRQSRRRDTSPLSWLVFTWVFLPITDYFYRITGDSQGIFSQAGNNELHDDPPTRAFVRSTLHLLPVSLWN